MIIKIGWLMLFLTKTIKKYTVTMFINILEMGQRHYCYLIICK